MTHHVRNGFTLVELLVVVTLIVILLGLLVPGMSKAIGKAEAVVCATTTRAWSHGMAQYAFDHKHSVLEFQLSNGNFWFHRLAPYMGQPGFGKNSPPVGAGIVDPLKAIMCVSANKIPPFMAEYESSTELVWALYGNVDTAWAMYRTRGTYTWNIALSKYDGWVPPFRYSKYTAAPGDTPLIADGIWVDLWAQGTDLPPDKPNGLITGRGDSSLGRICIDRHDLAVNISFVDGSAGTTPLGDLWTLNWHRLFEGTSAYQGEYFKTGYNAR